MCLRGYVCVTRLHARRQREVKACEEVESNHAQNRKKMDVRAPPAKLSTSKSSVLQSIYGEIICHQVFINEINKIPLKHKTSHVENTIQTTQTIHPC